MVKREEIEARTEELVMPLITKHQFELVDVEFVKEGSNRYFTDVIAMSFPTEDRARLFANALMDDNAQMFEASPIQKKLRAICIAIREAYDYQKDTQIFTWEQYLAKPIAPSK